MKIKTSNGIEMHLLGNEFKSECGLVESKDIIMEQVLEGKVEVLEGPTKRRGSTMWENLGLSKSDQAQIEKAFDSKVDEKTELLEEKYIAKLNEVIAKQKDSEILDESYVEKLEEVKAHLETEYKEQYEQLTETLDVYLQDLHQEWKEENKVQLQNESIVKNANIIVDQLTKVLSENNIELPVDKIDMYETEVNRVAELESDLNELMQSKRQLKLELLTIKKATIVSELADDMTYSNEIKYFELCEEIDDFNDLEDFADKAKLVKTRYFSEEVQTTKETPTKQNKRSAPINGDMSMFVQSLNK